MTTANDTAGVKPVIALPTDTINAPCNIANAVEVLWEHSARLLTPGELQWFVGLSDMAEMYTHNLEELMEGLGCLISNDDATRAGGVSMGSFQSSGGTSTLLFFLTDAVRLARAMHTLSRAAAFRLRYPKFAEDNAA
jgi:hypothetical protein